MNDFPEWTPKYIGLPWLNMGRDRAGLDCWGLIRLILAEQFAVNVPSYTEQYAADYDNEELNIIRRQELPSWREVKDPQPGDVIIFRVLGYPTHAGMIVNPTWMIHVQRGIDTVVERYTESSWKRRIIGLYRHNSIV